MERVRIIDVATKAGTSKSTVSQYMNGRFEYMSKQTKEKIKRAIDELNYTPNPIARSLKTQKTNTIGVIVNNIAGTITSQLIRGIDDYCKGHGYNVLIYNTDYDEAIEKKSINTLKLLGADGLIITSSGKINDLLNTQDQSGLPVVHIHREFEGLTVSSAMSDYHKGSYDATNYLIDLGHKRIALITRTYSHIPSREKRVNGYKDALRDSGLDLDESLIHLSVDASDIPTTYKQLMSGPNPPTAIFSLYSEITLDLLSFLYQKNIDIPEAISLIAFDDLQHGHLFKTPLTVINQHSHQLGEATAKLLLDRINSRSKEAKHVLLPCQLLIRDSCKKLH